MTSAEYQRWIKSFWPGNSIPPAKPRAARGAGRVGRAKAERCAAALADAGREPIRLVLPYPPTGNLYWRLFRGRLVVSAKARAYKAGVRAAAESSGVRPFVGDVRLTLSVYRPRKLGDLDNTLKVLGDALIGVGYVDDRQVVGIAAERLEDAANPRVEVVVTPAQPRNPECLT